MTAIDTIKAIQQLLGATPDGVWGPKTQMALNHVLDASSAPPQPAPLPDSQSPANPVDARSEANIATLLPPVRRYARALVKAAKDRGITLVVTSGTRTYDEQNELYEQGRSKPGKIVTNARGGYSNHNFGVAFDVTEFHNGQPVWESPNYAIIGKVGESLGLVWGGSWSSINDEPHFELHPAWAKDISESSMLAEFRKRHDSGQDVLA